ncbi:hypothetical protein FFLO_03926 [Filobasidium floriforme]|uniref:THO complex subunit 2 n=1 Tax=Filobasidium floriforme TaxID=5210 RepID=A0A8K0JLT3_9TREE|nr:hypothetical protein FFLO_03926 [Filobasidium floriforme]
MDPALEKGYLEAQDAVGSLTSEEAWTAQGEQRSRDLLVRSLDEVRTNATALPLLHILLYLLLQATYPSIASLATFFASFSEHPHIQYLQEAVIDVVTSVEEQENVRKEEAARLSSEIGTEVETNAVTEEGGLSRSLELLRALIIAKWMSSEQAAHLLPSTLTTLPALSLLPANSSAAKHSAAERRKRTAIFYKQKKYNVSREASEGYTAFLVLLSDDRYLGKGGEDEDATDRRRRAKALWKECLAVIGWYDLSPQRILDLMLDAFCQKLALHWRFYIDLLEFTPWSKRNLCSARSVGDEDVEEGAMETDEPAESRGMTDFKARLGEETGNRVLTQVLGFKFASHRYDDRDLKGVEQDPTAASQELFYVTAILIKQGLIRTVDILNHLTPDDTTMDSLVRAYKIKTQQDIRDLGGNALVTAAALPDDDSPSGAAAKASIDADIPKPRKEIPEQKIQLCEALLAIGQISSAFYIISRWPIVAQYSERVAILIMRIVRYALKPAYDIVEAARNEGMPPPGLNYRTHFAFGEPEVVDSLYCPEPIDTERRRFRFFFRGWTSQLERWTDPAEVISKVQPLMSIVGARAASDASVLIWLCRLGVYHTTQDTSESVRSAWVNLVRTSLLPAMPLLNANYGYNNELWPLLRPLPYQFRYSLYGEWHIAMSDSKDRSYIPVMGLAAAAIQNTTKQTLKRMTSELNRAHARAIGKGSYSAPTALWQAILPQIMSYENMIDTVVESARYLSNLGWDVTMFMLLDALSDESKERVKSDGLTASAWLQAVSSFIGRLAKRYTAMPLEPLMQQIGNQLKRQSLADLITLKQLISKMSGIEVAQDLTKAQVACLAGGPLMQREAIDLTQIRHPPPPTDDNERMSRGRPKKPPVYDNSRHRLIQALQSSGLILPILVAIAQAREACIFVATENLGHTKQLGLAFDDCNNVFNQYLRLLVAGLNTDELVAMLPSFIRLYKDFGVSWDLAYHIIRPQLHRSIYHDREAYLRLRLGWKNRSVDAAETHLITWNEEVVQPPLLPLVVDTARCVSAELHDNGLEPFMVTFWQLGLPELAVPDKAYARTISRLEASMARLETWTALRSLTAEWVDAYRSNKVELGALVDKIKAEQRDQEKLVATAAARLDSEKDNWFPEKPAIREKRYLAGMLHAACFYPRAIHSTVDALFVARFGQYLHAARTPNFSLLLFYEEFFPDSFVPFIFACSEAEVANLGQCMMTMLADLDRWHASRDVYEAEALGANPNENFDGLFYGMRLDGARHLDWEMFRNMCYKWHRRLTKAIIACLEAADYLHIKNGLTLAQRLIPAFPKVKRLYDDIIKSLDDFKLRERAREDPREDLLLVVQAYTSLLEAAKRDKSIKLVLTSDYCIPPGQANAKVAAPVPEANSKTDGDTARPASGIPKTEPISQEALAAPMAVDATPGVSAASTETITKEATEQVMTTKAEEVSAESPTDSDAKPMAPIASALDIPNNATVAQALQQLEAEPISTAESQHALAVTAAASPADLKTLREQLTLRKAQGKAKAVASPAAEESAIPVVLAEDKSSKDSMSMEVDGAVDISVTPPSLPVAEVRKIDTSTPAEPISRLSSRRSSVTPSDLPRGPRADLEREASIAARISSPMVGRSRDTSPAARPKAEELSTRSREMPPPPAPREMREKENSDRQTRRDISPHRPSRSRNGSADSKTSRISASRRDADRQRKPLDSRRDESDSRIRQPEDSLRDRVKESDTRRSDRDRERERDRDRDRDRDREADKRRDRPRERDHDARGKPRERVRDKEDRDRGRDKDKDRSVDSSRKDSERTRDRRDHDRIDRDRGDDRSRNARDRDDRKGDRDSRRDHRDRDRERNRSRDSERGSSKTASRETASERASDRARGDRDRERERERSPVRAGRRDKDRSEDNVRPKEVDDRQRGSRTSRVDEDTRGSTRRDILPVSEVGGRDPSAHLDALASRFDDNRRSRMSTVATPMSDQSPKTNKVAENGSAREEPHRPHDGGNNGNATPRLAERMGLTSRNDTSGDGRDRQSRSIQPEAALNRNGSHASVIESLTLRTDRDPPPHSSSELRQANRDSASSRSHTREKPTEDRKQISVSSTSTPVKASLSSRLGVIVDANPSGSQPVPDTSSPKAVDRSAKTSEISRSPDRKRTHEESTNETPQANSTPTNPSKRPRIDRAGARERGGALSRLSGGFLSKK